MDERAGPVVPEAGPAGKEERRETSGWLGGGGLFLHALVRRTWVKVGKTPVHDGWGRHLDKVSVIGAVSVSTAAQRCEFSFATEPDEFFATVKVVEFFQDLLQHLRLKMVVW